ncbi:MAG: glycosyl transferase, partial [Campylobacterota bacterium]|nr:glycosyl transferase [Campylobacterota bacterium]
MKNYAIKKSIVDIPNGRSSHVIPVPYGGGIAITITWLAGISYLFSIDQIKQDLFCALLIGAVLAVTSYIDDLYRL